MMNGTKSWLKQSITLSPKTGYGSSGLPTYGSTTTISCLIQQKNVNTLDKGGNDVVSSTQIITSGDVTIDSEDRITLPDGKTPKIIRVESIVGFDGLPYTKVIYT